MGSGPTGFRRSFWRRFQEALVQGQIRCNRVPKKIPEKVWEALTGFRRRFQRRFG
jgi:hypothetical protein